MSQRTLREFGDEIRSLIQRQAYTEAIHTARHVLYYFPKHLDTYLLLGEACLESGSTREAIEMFQRVLSADPENLMAWVGLAEAYQQDELPELGLWYLERAFEVDPTNPDLRAELQRLYAQVRGVKELRVKLNGPALGRIYLRGGLYHLAVEEFQAALDKHPDYYHVHVGLATALWRMDRRVEAAAVCQDILETLPNCLPAALILGTIWSRGDQPEEGERLLRMAEAMDPENRRAAELLGEASPLPPKEPVLPPVGVLPAGLRTPAPARAEAKPLVSPVPMEEAEEEIPAERPLEEAVLPPPEEAPAWVEEIAPPAEAVPPVFLPEEEVPTETAEAPTAEELPPAPAVPDWLAEIAAPPAPAGEEEFTPEAEALIGEIPPMPEAEAVPPQAPPEELPPAPITEEAEAPVAPEDLLKLAAELPEELRALVEEAMAREITPPPAAPAEKAAEVELPPWLVELAEEGEKAEVREAPAETAAPAEPAEEEIPAWLRELAQKEAATEAPVAEEEAIPPWLESRLEQAAPAIPPAETAIPAEEEPAPVEEIPEWLQRLRQAAIHDIPALESELAAGQELLLEQETGVPAHELELTPSAEEVPPPAEEVSVTVSASMLEEIWMAAVEGLPLAHEEEIAPVPEALEAQAVPAEGAPAPEAEEAAEMPPLEEIAPAAEVGIEEQPIPLAEEQIFAVPSPSPFIAQAQERLRVRPDDHEMRLALARAWRDAGQLESALQEYSALVEADQFVESIVSDLEHLVAELGEGIGSAPAWTVLGDAYMRQGRLSDALDAYRRALGRKPA